jgi:hypothetical protein
MAALWRRGARFVTSRRGAVAARQAAVTACHQLSGKPAQPAKQFVFLRGKEKN